MTREEFDVTTWVQIDSHLDERDPLITRNRKGELLIFTKDMFIGFPELKKDGMGRVVRYYPLTPNLKVEFYLLKTYPDHFIEGTKPRFT